MLKKIVLTLYQVLKYFEPLLTEIAGISEEELYSVRFQIEKQKRGIL